MLDIHHCLIVHAPEAEVFAALTDEMRASVSALGVVIRDLLVEEEEVKRAGASARAQVLDGPADWIGTEILIDVGASPQGTVVHLTHRNWRAPVLVVAAHTTRWGQVLLGLKKRVEMPEPTDTF